MTPRKKPVQEPLLDDPLTVAQLKIDQLRAKLRSEIRPLRQIADGARYRIAQAGYAGCVEDDVCEEGLIPCPHVTVHYATYTDRLVLEGLIHMMGGMWERIRQPPTDPQQDIIGDLVDALQTAACQALTMMDDDDPRGERIERPEVFTAIATAYEAEQDVWSDDQQDDT